MTDTIQKRDPFEILAVSKNASTSEIRAAYLEKVRVHPPEKEPELFEAIRDAYCVLKDERSRLSFKLFHVDPEVPLLSLLDNHHTERLFVGPKLWLETLKEKP